MGIGAIIEEQIDHDLLAITRFRNALLHRLKGSDSGKDLAEKIGVSPSLLSAYLTLRETPINRFGEYKPAAKKIAQHFGYTAQELFPANLYKLKLPREVHRLFESERLAPLFEAKEIRYLQDEEETDKGKLGGVLESVLKTLTAREKKVLELRFGLNGQEPLGLDETGDAIENKLSPDRCGVSRTRISQIESKALRKLRHPTRSRQLRQFLMGSTFNFEPTKFYNRIMPPWVNPKSPPAEYAILKSPCPCGAKPHHFCKLQGREHGAHAERYRAVAFPYEREGLARNFINPMHETPTESPAPPPQIQSLSAFHKQMRELNASIQAANICQEFEPDTGILALVQKILNKATAFGAEIVKRGDNKYQVMISTASCAAAVGPLIMELYHTPNADFVVQQEIKIRIENGTLTCKQA